MVWGRIEHGGRTTFCLEAKSFKWRKLVKRDLAATRCPISIVLLGKCVKVIKSANHYQQIL